MLIIVIAKVNTDCNAVDYDKRKLEKRAMRGCEEETWREIVNWIRQK